MWFFHVTTKFSNNIRCVMPFPFTHSAFFCLNSRTHFFFFFRTQYTMKAHAITYATTHKISCFSYDKKRKICGVVVTCDNELFCTGLKYELWACHIHLMLCVILVAWGFLCVCVCVFRDKRRWKDFPVVYIPQNICARLDPNQLHFSALLLFQTRIFVAFA